jgi:hypothetical protein
MRIPNSLFDRTCRFINSSSAGESYTTKDYISTVGQYENNTRWKTYSNNRYYTTYGYRSLLRATGFTKQVKRGVWVKLKHIPDWFDYGHLNTLAGYTVRGDNGKWICEYKGLTRADIRLLLDTGNSPKNIAVTPSEPKPVIFGKGLPLINVSSHAAGSIDLTRRETYPADVPSAEYIAGSIGCTVEKITKEESQFINQSKREIPTHEIVNLGLLRSAIASTDMITTSDSILHARVLNAITILQDIEKSMSAKIDAQLFNGKL